MKADSSRSKVRLELYLYRMLLQSYASLKFYACPSYTCLAKQKPEHASISLIFRAYDSVHVNTITSYLLYG